MRTLCTALFALGLAAPALAEEPASTAAVYACANMADDAARLACYDNAVGRLKAAEDAGEVTTVSRAEVEQVKKDSFGFSIPSLPKLAMPKMGGGDGELKQVELAISEVRKTGYGKLVVTLENGQVWEQSDTMKMHVSKKRAPQTATIKAARLGSFMMKLDGGRAFRAKRVK